MSDFINKKISKVPESEKQNLMERVGNIYKTFLFTNKPFFGRMGDESTSISDIEAFHLAQSILVGKCKKN
ncbi:TPA: hypothetical protein ACTXXA_003097 [Legionella anisa]